jgi:hypothetical protein
MDELKVEQILNKSFDGILFQLSKGNTVEGLKRGVRWHGFEQVKEWKSRFGYQFHIYSNDHLINNKPHFHLKKPSENIDCRIFFDGTIYDCKGDNFIDKKVKEAVEYFISIPKNQNLLIEFWNHKNPSQKHPTLARV